jgi:hypothetical protein
MLDWFKRSWTQLLILLGLSIGSLVMWLNRRRLPAASPPAPEVPPVEVPIVHIHPSDDYADRKSAPVDVSKNGTAQVIAAINVRHTSK